MTSNRTVHIRTNARRISAGAAFLAVCITLAAFSYAHAGSSPTEQEVKAAFIYNLAKFVEFPSSAFTNGDSPIVLGVLDDDRFADVLERTVKGKAANGRRLEVKRFSKISQCDSCQILYTSSNDRERISSVLDKVKNANVLTVGDSDGFARRGGVVGFLVENSKIGFEINVGAAKRHGLKISSKLLSLAKSVIS